MNEWITLLNTYHSKAMGIFCLCEKSIFFRDFFPQIMTKLSPSLQQLSSYVFLPSALCQLKFLKRKNWADLLPLFDV